MPSPSIDRCVLYAEKQSIKNQHTYTYGECGKEKLEIAYSMRACKLAGWLNDLLNIHAGSPTQSYSIFRLDSVELFGNR